MLTLIIIVLAVAALVLLVGRPDHAAARAIASADAARRADHTDISDGASSLGSIDDGHAGVWPDVSPGTSPSSATGANSPTTPTRAV